MLATISPLGTLANQRQYDVWGAVRAEQDVESSLVYMRARYYDPGTGRFVTEDPARDGGNWFVYCGNDAVNPVDPTGTVTIFFGKGLMKLLDWFHYYLVKVVRIQKRERVIEELTSFLKHVDDFMAGAEPELLMDFEHASRKSDLRAYDATMSIAISKYGTARVHALAMKRQAQLLLEMAQFMAMEFLN